MLGLMQDRPLLISSPIEHASTFQARIEIVSRTPELPHTATGKLLKTKLREQYQHHALPDASR